MSLPTKSSHFFHGAVCECTKFILPHFLDSLGFEHPRIVCEASQSLMDACDGFLVSEVDSTLEATSVTAPNSLFLCLMIFSFFFRIERRKEIDMWNECHVFFFVCNFFGWTHLWGKNLKESDDLDHGLQEEVRVPICCAAVRARVVTLDMFWRGKKFDTANGLSNLRYFLLDFYWLNISIRSLNIKLVFLHYISPIFFCTHTGVNQSCLVGTFALRPWKQRWHWKKHGKTTIWRCISPIENGDIRASHVSFQVFFSACLWILFEAMPDGTDSPIWRALSAQVRREIYGQGGM